MQIGLARSSAVVKSKTDYQLWEHPSLDSGRQSVNGPCVAVRDGALYIASRQYRGVFMVEPLALNGDVNPAVQLTIEYPNC